MPKPKFSFFRFFSWLVAALAALLVAAGISVYYYLHAPLDLPEETVDFVIEPGSSVRKVAATINEAGIELPPDVLVAYARLTGIQTRIQAGGYALKRGESLMDLFRKLDQADVTQRQILFVEGWNLRQIRAALAAHPDVRQTLQGVGNDQLGTRVGAPVEHGEGLFFPDTYLFSVGTTDLEILKRAFHAQQRVLEDAWAQRDEGLPLRSPYEALILASIIEKETGREADRNAVAGVFINRLRAGMLLQTDPTVIYGVGETFDGNLTRLHLRTDTPWNTYTRAGLPPTPIAAVGRPSIQAALQPEKHGYYYFVARGDGTSQFSKNLADHNRAVRTYQLKRRTQP